VALMSLGSLWLIRWRRSRLRVDSRFGDSFAQFPKISAIFTKIRMGDADWLL
jgi:hypothetical protein